MTNMVWIVLAVAVICGLACRSIMTSKGAPAHTVSAYTTYGTFLGPLAIAAALLYRPKQP
jgi:hypothetical protein